MIEWLTGIVGSAGYLGVAALMFLENLFPPIPSELVMPLAGFAAARGDMALVPMLLAGIAGSLAGAVFWYLVGLRVGRERVARWAARHGRLLTLTPDEVEDAAGWFDRHGGKAVFLGRMVPAVRTLISVPAGVAAMAWPSFLALSALGTALWCGLLALAGYLLEDQYSRVAHWLNPVSNVVVAALIAWYVYRVATFRRRVGRA